MTDWDEIRYFLAVARAGTVRGAAERLCVNHSTVLRRVGQLEKRLAALLFDRMPSGYRLSATGREVLETAEEMEHLAGRFAATVAGRDEAAAGPLRVTLPPTLASHLLAEDLADFVTLHPEVELEVLTSNALINLTNREADIAIRVVYDRETLPLNLYGVKGPLLYGALYMSRDLLAAHASAEPFPIRWIVRTEHGVPDWAGLTDLPITEPPFRTNDSESQIAAVRRGLGVTALSCFVGDADPLLMRAPGSPVHLHGTVWVLTQGETRKTKRVRLFTEFISARLADHAASLGGDIV